MTRQRETRELLVEHAIGLVEEVGLAGFAAREVARRAGVSHAAPFRHFQSRTALLADAAVNGFRDLRVRLVAAAGPPATAKHDLVIRLGMEYVAFAQERPAMFELMFRNDLLNGAAELVHEHCLSVFALMVDGATGDDPRSAVALKISLLAGVQRPSSVTSSRTFRAPGQSYEMERFPSTAYEWATTVDRDLRGSPQELGIVPATSTP